MEESQFDDLKSEIEHIQMNTSWTWHNNNELEKLNGTMSDIKKLIDENNEMMHELIQLMKKK